MTYSTPAPSNPLTNGVSAMAIADREEQNEGDGAIPRSLEEGHWLLA